MWFTYLYIPLYTFTRKRRAAKRGFLSWRLEAKGADGVWAERERPCDALNNVNACRQFSIRNESLSSSLQCASIGARGGTKTDHRLSKTLIRMIRHTGLRRLKTDQK